MKPFANDFLPNHHIPDSLNNLYSEENYYLGLEDLISKGEEVFSTMKVTEQQVCNFFSSMNKLKRYLIPFTCFQSIVLVTTDIFVIPNLLFYRSEKKYDAS